MSAVLRDQAGSENVLTNDDLDQIIVMKHHAALCGLEEDARIPLALIELREGRAEIARLRAIISSLPAALGDAKQGTVDPRPDALPRAGGAT